MRNFVKQNYEVLYTYKTEKFYMKMNVYFSDEIRYKFKVILYNAHRTDILAVMSFENLKSAKEQFAKIAAQMEKEKVVCYE